ncbi:hypothetical protein ACSBR1_014856 [Camellia fascicularis]
MGMQSRNTNPSKSSSSSSFLPPRCIPLLVFFFIFAFLFFFNLDTFLSRTKAIARHSFNEQTPGTVTTYYLSSEGPTHDEIDFEFLGNSSGDPYTLHTNVYCQGKGNREQQFFLWFDPTTDFHTYSILWNPHRIVFSVDGTPIREFKNMESKGIPFPKDQPMRVYSSLWNADDWATKGGLVKTDWKKAPFTASYRNYKADACIWSEGASSCNSKSPTSNSIDYLWMSEKLNSTSLERMKWVQKNHMVYNYCIDKMRFPEGLAPECKFS